MLTFCLFILALAQPIHLANNEKRILLNDPGLTEQRLTNLEHKIQTVESENQLLKDRINQYETAKSGRNLLIRVCLT